MAARSLETPLHAFEEAAVINARYWEARTRDLGEERYKQLDVDRENIRKAIDYGQMLPSAWEATARAAIHLSSTLYIWGLISHK